MDDFIRWNNRVVSAKSLVIQIAGIPFQGIKSLKYKDKLEKELVHGDDRDGVPIGMTSGKYSAEEVSVAMLVDTFRLKFLPAMGILSAANLAPGSWGGASFPIVVSYYEPPMPTLTDIISGCEPTGAEDAYDEGAGAVLTTVTFQPMAILRNGLSLFNRLRAIP